MTDRWAIGKIIEIGGKRYFEWRKHGTSKKGNNEALAGEASDVSQGLDASLEVKSREQNGRNAESQAKKVRHSR